MLEFELQKASCHVTSSHNVMKSMHTGKILHVKVPTVVRLLRIGVVLHLLQMQLPPDADLHANGHTHIFYSTHMHWKSTPVCFAR